MTESTPSTQRGEVAWKEETAGAGSSKPTASLEETGPMSSTAHQPPTTARDIRVGPSAAVPGREAASQATPGQSLSVQPPVELSHRTEGEGAEGAAAERKAAGGPTAPAVPLEEKEPSSRGPWQTPTSARDIRMGPTMASGEEVAAQAPAGQRLPVQAPVELSYRTDAEEPSPGAPRIEAGTKESRTGDGRRASSPRPEEPGKHRPTPQHAPTTARDIRVGPAAGLVAQNATASGPAQSPAGGQMMPPPEMIFGTSGQAPEEGPTHSQRQTSPKVQAQKGQTAQSKAGQLPLAPLTLSYGPLPPPTSPPPQDPGTGAAQQAEESEYVRSLPDWARRFLKNGAPTQGNQTMGVARDIATLPPPVPEDTVQWTAPNYRPPEAPVTLREKSQPTKPSPAQEVRITEAEIQRTADRVYQMLEDRIRRERRRLGL